MCQKIRSGWPNGATAKKGCIEEYVILLGIQNLNKDHATVGAQHTRTAKIFIVKKEHRNPIFHTLGSNELQPKNINKHGFNILFKEDVLCRSCPD